MTNSSAESCIPLTHKTFEKGLQVYLRCPLVSAIALFAAIGLGFAYQASGQDDPVVDEILAFSQELATSFNAGKADEVAAMFVDQAELIDEEGVVHKGPEEIKQLLTAFFERFPGAQLGEEIDSIRSVGPIVVKEGVRTITTADESSTSRIRFIATYTKGDRGWRIVSLRDFPEDSLPTPGEQLQVLDWLVGEWVNEGADARVRISYQWSEDKNFILGEFTATDAEGNENKSSQRIAWDALHGRPCSWFFDSDGGFTQGSWNATDEGWLINNSATLPNGATGSATLKITPRDNGRFVIAGINRVVDGQLEEDFEITVVKQAPSPGK